MWERQRHPSHPPDPAQCYLLQEAFQESIPNQMWSPISFYFIFLMLFRAALVAYWSFQARGHIGAVAANLHHKHNNAGSEPYLWPTPQLMATPDPQPTEQGRWSNLHPCGYWSDLFPLHHSGNSFFRLLNVSLNILILEFLKGKTSHFRPSYLMFGNIWYCMDASSYWDLVIP